MMQGSGQNPPPRRRPAHRAALAAAILLASLAPSAASAHTRHHRLMLPPPAPGAPADASLGPTAPGFSAILIDAASGQVLSATGADMPRYPASLTKLMVLDLTFQALRGHRLSLNTPVPVSLHAASVQPVKLGLRPGDSLTVGQAILSMTTMSANDAATALGELLGGGSEQRCADMMTLRAQALGMAQTHFDNASGLPDPNQVTTARDLAILARDIVVSYPDFQAFFEQTQFDLNGRTIYSNNQMLKIYPGATGLKTGYTMLARHNLITSAERGGHTLIGVVLHEPSWGTSYAQMTAMLDQGFGTPTPADMAFLSTQSRLNRAGQRAPAIAALSSNAAPDPAQNSGQEVGQGSDQIIPPPGHASAHASAQSSVYPTPYLADWTAQFGSYSRIESARHAAIEAAQIDRAGIPRIGRLKRHGRILYTAQLAGLTQAAAHQACWAMAARRTACTIIPPQADHLAALGRFSG